MRKMLDEADAKDAEEDWFYGPDKRGDELSAHLADRTSRRARLAACKQRLEEQAVAEAAKQQSRIEERQVQEASASAKKRGRLPQEPDPTPEATAKANVTDPDSRIVKTRSGYIYTGLQQPDCGHRRSDQRQSRYPTLYALRA